MYSFYLVLLLIFTILVPLQTYANTRQRHPITRLLTFGLATEFVALLATNVHHSIFSFNGLGIPWLATIGEIGQIFSQVGSETQNTSFKAVALIERFLIFFEVSIYDVAPSFGHGLGCHETRTQVQDADLHHLAHLLHCTLPSFHMEKGIASKKACQENELNV